MRRTSFSACYALDDITSGALNTKAQSSSRMVGEHLVTSGVWPRFECGRQQKTAGAAGAPSVALRVCT